MGGALTRRRALAIVVSGLAACTAKGPRYVPGSITPTGEAGLIYVYRPLGTIATRGESPFVTVGRKSHGALKAGSFIAATVPEGDVVVTAQQSLFMLIPTIQKSVTVTVVAGATSYVRVDQKIVGTDFSKGVTVSQSIEIEEVSRAEGQAELAETRQNG